MHAIKDEPRDDDVNIKMSFAQKNMTRSKMKRKREDHALSESLLYIILHKLMRHTSNDVMDSPATTSTPHLIKAAKPTDEDIFETTNNSFTTSVRHQM